VKTPDPQPRSATRAPRGRPLNRTKAEISRALASGVNTSYSSLDAWASKNAISFSLSWTLPMLMTQPAQRAAPAAA
jgi:hypothetical protein